MASLAVIVTRPATTGERLRARLQTAGFDACWWPAFELGPAPDEAQARATLARLGDFDLAVFVSPQSVHSVRTLMASPWPRATRIGAVGAATAAVVRELLQTEGARLLAPDAADTAGSEAFWFDWVRQGFSSSRALILRAQHGREWLAEQFAAAGTQVESLAVYTRNDCMPTASALAWMQSAMRADSQPVTVFSSSEAVGAFARQLAGIVGAVAWAKSGVALATHARIRDRLLSAGYMRVELSAPDDDAVVTRLESLQFPRLADP